MEFFWDVSSPYTYLAWTQLGALTRTGAAVRYRPFLLGGVFKASGNVAPAVVPAKGIYLSKDLERWRAHHGVALKLPIAEVTFPINSVLPMRLAAALSAQGQAEQICAALMRTYWQDGLDVSEPEVLTTMLQGMGLDAEALLAQAGTQPVKDSLRSASDEAVARGAFGAPTFFVKDQMFFGHDRMHFVQAALEG